MEAILTAMWLAVLLGVAIVLSVLFARSRNAGYILLIVALVGWPLASRLVFPRAAEAAIRWTREGGSAPFPFSMIFGGAQSPSDAIELVYLSWSILQVLLLLAGVSLLAVGSGSREERAVAPSLAPGDPSR